MKGPLHTVGQQIVDKDGRPLRLTGLNEVSLVPVNGWKATSPKVAQDMKSWGFNSVRLCFPWQNFETSQPTKNANGSITHHYNSDFQAVVEDSVQVFTDLDIAVILSGVQQHNMSDLQWKGQPGVFGQGLPHWLFAPDVSTAITEDQARADFFSDKADADGLPAKPWDLLAAYEAHLARTFASNDMVVAIDVFNEPFSYNSAADQDLNAMYETVGRAIRSANKDITLIFEQSQYNPKRGFAMSRMPSVSNAVYSFHLYKPTIADAMPELEAHLDLAHSWGVPVWLGEYVGFTYIEHGDPQQLVDHRELLNILKQHGASWSYYVYYGNPGGLTDSRGRLTARGTDQLGVLQAGI